MEGEPEAGAGPGPGDDTEPEPGIRPAAEPEPNPGPEPRAADGPVGTSAVGVELAPVAARLLTVTGATVLEGEEVGAERGGVAGGGPGVDVGDGPRSVPPGRGAAAPLPGERMPVPPGVPPGEEDGAVRAGTARCTL